MDRRLTVFPCAGEWLGGTLDAAPGGTGLLIVSGGSEVRIGAHRGMALLAARPSSASSAAASQLPSATRRRSCGWPARKAVTAARRSGPAAAKPGSVPLESPIPRRS